MIDHREEQIKLLSKQLKLPTFANYTDILRQAKALIGKYRTAFALCEKLRCFGWRDVNSLDDARKFILERE